MLKVLVLQSLRLIAEIILKPRIRQLRRARPVLSNEYLTAKIGLNTADHAASFTLLLPATHPLTPYTSSPQIIQRWKPFRKTAMYDSQ